MSAASRVALRYKLAKTFPSEKALKTYLDAHPKADKSKHRVEDADVQRIKDEVAPHAKIKKDQEKAEKNRGKAKEKRDDEKTKKDLTKHQEEHPRGTINWDYDPKNRTKDQKEKSEKVVDEAVDKKRE